MKTTLNIQGSTSELDINKDTKEIIFDIHVEGENTIFHSKALGLSFSCYHADKIDSINVSIGESSNSVIVNYNENSLNEARCCVTCNGTTFCGHSACCQLTDGRWLCC